MRDIRPGGQRWTSWNSLSSARRNGVAGDVFLGDLAGAEFGGDSALAHHEHTVREADHLGQFGRNDEDGPSFAGEAFDQGVDLGLGPDVDAAGRFIEQEDARVGGQPAADDRLLLVTARKAADGARDVKGRSWTSRINSSDRAFRWARRIRPSARNGASQEGRCWW
jgi:hypothetical protein